MSETDLFIIAAGKGSRMDSNVPKALVPIVDEPCLTTTLQQLGHKFRKVFVVANILVEGQWASYIKSLEKEYPELTTNLHIVFINSGLGDGHATWKGLIESEDHVGEDPVAQDIVIAWGDVFFPQAEIIDELLSHTLYGSGLFPAVGEKNPYVSLLVDDQMRCVSADFSKYGENHPTGFHDQSVFRFDRSHVVGALHDLHNAFWKNGRYITPGGELSLLHTFHQLFNSGDPAYVYETDYPTLSFNSREEVAAIQQEIDTKWKFKFRK